MIKKPNINIRTKVLPTIQFGQVIEKMTSLQVCDKVKEDCDIDKECPLYVIDNIPNSYTNENIHIEVLNHNDGYMIMINPIVEL